MTILTYLLIAVEAITCFVLVVVILLQRSKQYGAGLAFGAGMGETLFGARAGNVLTRTTVILATIFLINTLVLSVIGTRRSTASRSVMDKVKPPAGAVVPSAQPDVPSAVPSVPGGADAGTLTPVTPAAGAGTGTVPPPAGAVPAAPATGGATPPVSAAPAP